ncbi:hypothetical protein ACF0H5_017602 [Mactra antiquata]
MNPNFRNQGFRQQGMPGQMMMPNGPMMPQGQFMNPGQGQFMGPPPGQMMMGQPMMGMRMRPAGAPPSYNQALNQSMQQRPRGQVMNPNAGKTEEQILKEKHYHEQKAKLKQFGKTGASTLDPNKLVDSIFGSSHPSSKPKQQQQAPQQQPQAAANDADDGFGDFLSSSNISSIPITQTQMPGPGSTPGIQANHIGMTPTANESTLSGMPSQPINMASQIPVNTEKKDITKMMMDSCDLTAPQKAKLFHKPSLKEINPTHTPISVHHTSHNARRWTQNEELSQLFLQEAVKDESTIPKKPVKHVSPTSKHPPKPPPWFNDTSLIPPVYKQVYEACLVGNQISTERLYPILMLSGLPKEVMGQLWSLCNKTTPGQLIEKELYQLLAVIALTQNNFKVETLDILCRCPKAPVPFLAPAGSTVPPQSPIQMIPTSPTLSTGETSPNIVTGVSPPQMPGYSTAQIPVQTIGQPNFAPGVSQVPLHTGINQGVQQVGPVPMTLGPVPHPMQSVAPGNFPLGANSTQNAIPNVSHMTGNQANMMTSPMTSAPATLPVTQLPPAGLTAGNAANTANTVNDDDDDDFADFQTASMSPPKQATSVQQSISVVKQLSQKNTNQAEISYGDSKSPTKLSHDLKHSTVENFFGSDDSLGSNSPDDDFYDGYKSADSKPSDSTSQFSTDQSEGEDFRNFENYLDEFQRKKDMQDKESPLHRPVSKFLGKTKTPSPTIVKVQYQKPPEPIKRLPFPAQTKVPVTQINPSSDEFSDFADFQSAPVAASTNNQTATGPDLMKASGSTIDLIGDEDKYAALRSLDFSTVPDEPEPNLLGEPDEADVKPQTDSEDNWADFQAAGNDENAPKMENQSACFEDKNSNSPEKYSTMPDSEESDWAAFESGVRNTNQDIEMSGFKKAPVGNVSLFNASNVITGTVAISDMNEEETEPDDGDDWANFKESTDDFAEFQSTPQDDIPKSSDSNTGVVNIKRDKLDTNDIMGLFKVKTDIKPVVFSRDDEDDVLPLSKPNISLSASVNAAHGINYSQTEVEKASIPENVKTKHLSEDDDFMKPPPLDNFVEDDHDDFSSYSRGYEDLDDILAQKIPEKKKNFGMYGLNENFVVHGHKERSSAESNDIKNITIEVTKDSDGDNDTDSVSSKDNEMFREKFGLKNVVAEDSQSIASLELVTNKSLQNVRDQEGNDTQSVSSNEFGNFEIGVNRDTLAESKSLDSLDLRQEDGVDTGSSLDNSDKDSKEESPPREEDYSKPVFDIPTSVGLPIIGDRYSAIMHDVQGSDKHASEWEKCLDQCCRMIQDANNTFNSISKSSVCNEVINSSQGSVYIQGVIEIYKIVCKISVTMNKSGIHSDKLTILLKDIDLAWNNLTAFLVGGSVMPEEQSLIFDHGTLSSDDTSLQYLACGVCLLNVEMKMSNTDIDNVNAKLTYGGRQYHASCANFWINCVDSTLPALKLPELL